MAVIDGDGEWMVVVMDGGGAGWAHIIYCFVCLDDYVR